MKIISLNIAGRNNFGEDYEKRLQRVAAFLDKEQADIVCLQEVAFLEHESIAERINSMMATPYPYFAAQMCEKYGQDKFSEGILRKWQSGDIEHVDGFISDGLAVLSKIPITKNSTTLLKPAPVDERGRPDYGIRIAQVLELESKLTLTNVHFASNNNSHLQLAELLSYRKTDLVVGDFNMFAEDIQARRKIWSQDYQLSLDFEPYTSFPSEGVTLDYMLLKPEMSFTSIRTQEGLSDHSAMIYEIDTK